MIERIVVTKSQKNAKPFRVQTFEGVSKTPSFERRFLTQEAARFWVESYQTLPRREAVEISVEWKI